MKGNLERWHAKKKENKLVHPFYYFLLQTSLSKRTMYNN
jgi:hypothetical protein